MERSPFSFPRRSSVCAKKGEVFEPGTHYVSYLVDENSRLLRLDYCLACWQNESPPKKGWVWQGKIPFTASLERPYFKKEEELLFTLLDGDGDPALIYFLAHFLKRKKVFIFRGEDKKRKLDYFEWVETQEIIAIKQVTLSKEVGEKVAEAWKIKD